MAYKQSIPKAKEQNNAQTVSPYDQQASNFLKKTNTTFKIKYLKHDKYFPDDKEERDIYRFTLTKDGKSYSGTFGQSIAHTGQEPRPYEVLSSLSADMGEEDSYEEFADAFGYDRDSHSGRQIFKAVQKERAGLKNLYSEEELNKLGEII